MQNIQEIKLGEKITTVNILFVDTTNSIIINFVDSYKINWANY